MGRRGVFCKASARGPHEETHIRKSSTPSLLKWMHSCAKSNACAAAGRAFRSVIASALQSRRAVATFRQQAPRWRQGQHARKGGC